jgi:phosphoribosylaminoimidazolecarboxamide formyltransferase/IMP cyclohydrolase
MADNGGAVSDATRFDLAVKAFEHTAAYDGAIANHLGRIVEHPEGKAEGLPRTFNLQFRKQQPMRYGENPHQQAAFYVARDRTEASIASATQLQGKALSYNNIADTDAALECVKQFNDAPTCVIVKHANPCGVAYRRDLLRPTSAPFDRPRVGLRRHHRLQPTAGRVDRQAIVERSSSRSSSHRASATRLRKVAAKKNVRLLVCGDWTPNAVPYARFQARARRPAGAGRGPAADRRSQGRDRQGPTEAQMRDLLFTWRVAKFVKSNAIVYGRDGMTIGVGAGQMSRVNSARIAAIKAEQAGLEVQGAVMASDAFFPFRDGIDQAAEKPASPPSSSPAARCATTRSSPPPTSTAWPWSSPACGISGTE